MGQLEKIESNNSYGIENHTWSALKTVVYDGAKDESIKLVLDYCKANSLDPMHKPVHIVSMGSYNAQNKWVQKDTIWVGIGLYRIQAERSGNYAGISEPEYGNIVEGTFTKINKDCREEVKVSYPEWCKITVRKIVHDHIVEFTAKEYWIENYSKLNKTSTAPNAMWMSRPFGQLAKCAEAQALRKAFPELIPQQPTAEEMEGKIFNGHDVTNNSNKLIESKTLTSKLDKFLEEPETLESILTIPSNENCLELQKLISQHNISEELVLKWCDAAGVTTLEELDEDKIRSCIDYITKKTQNTPIII